MLFWIILIVLATMALYAVDAFDRLVLACYDAAWNVVGRDPRPGTIIPLFHPPNGISPALANYIHR